MSPTTTSAGAVIVEKSMVKKNEKFLAANSVRASPPCADRPPGQPWRKATTARKVHKKVHKAVRKGRRGTSSRGPPLSVAARLLDSEVVGKRWRVSLRPLAKTVEG